MHCGTEANTGFCSLALVECHRSVAGLVCCKVRVYILLLLQDELRDAVLLVFANKQDLPNAMNAAEITDKLGLHSLKQRHWYEPRSLRMPFMPQ